MRSRRSLIFSILVAAVTFSQTSFAQMDVPEEELAKEIGRAHV